MKLAKIFLTAMCLAALLCGCSRETRVVGTWVSCGDPGSGREHDFDVGAVDQWVFSKDGTVAVTADGETVEYRYSMTGSTLTLQGEPVSYGLLYKLKGDRFSIYDGNETYVGFERAED